MAQSPGGKQKKFKHRLICCLPSIWFPVKRTHSVNQSEPDSAGTELGNSISVPGCVQERNGDWVDVTGWRQTTLRKLHSPLWILGAQLVRNGMLPTLEMRPRQLLFCSSLGACRFSLQSWHWLQITANSWGDTGGEWYPASDRIQMGGWDKLQKETRCLNQHVKINNRQ